MAMPLIQSLADTGTPNGQTGIVELGCGCARKYWLDKQHRASLPEPLYFTIGSIYHAYQRLYYERQMEDWEPKAVKFINAPPNSLHEEAMLEAERLFSAYRKIYPPEELGKVIAVEKLLPEGEIDGAVVVPNDPKQAAAIDKAVGFPGYTGRVDLVVYLSEEDIERLRKTRNLNHLRKPGYYMVDWKTAYKFGPKSFPEKEAALQFMFYQLAWNAAFPAMPLQGLIGSYAVKTKVPRFEHVLCPPAKTLERRIVRKVSARALKVLNEQKPPYEANPARCYDYGACRYMELGLCKRY